MSIRASVLSHALTQGPKCRVAQLLASLDTAERAELLEVLADPSVQHTALSRWSATRGPLIPTLSVANHRNGVCSCAQLERLRSA